MKLVQTSWEKVLPIAEQAAELFYGKLFELDPQLRPLFKSDMKEQGKKLMAMLTTAVRSHNSLDDFVPALQGLAQRHVQYEVEPEHYDTVGAALLWTLEQGLGPDIFTEECQVAWADTYKLISDTMIEAAYLQDRR